MSTTSNQGYLEHNDVLFIGLGVHCPKTSETLKNTDQKRLQWLTHRQSMAVLCRRGAHILLRQAGSYQRGWSSR